MSFKSAFKRKREKQEQEKHKQMADDYVTFMLCAFMVLHFHFFDIMKRANRLQNFLTTFNSYIDKLAKRDLTNEELKFIDKYAPQLQAIKG